MPPTSSPCRGRHRLPTRWATAPSIVLHQGTTEDWIVENRTLEDHVFHIHQTRFQTLAVNGAAVSDPALRDTINVPHWSGSGPYPSVKLRVDFRSANIVGTFVFHCHILAHEDLGMMAAIQVLPQARPRPAPSPPRPPRRCRGPLTLTARVLAASAGRALGHGAVLRWRRTARDRRAGRRRTGRPVHAAGLLRQSRHLGGLLRGRARTTNRCAAAVRGGRGLHAQCPEPGHQAGTLRERAGADDRFEWLSSVVDFSCSVPANLPGPPARSPRLPQRHRLRHPAGQDARSAALGSATTGLPLALATLSCLCSRGAGAAGQRRWLAALCGITRWSSVVAARTRQAPERPRATIRSQ